MSSDAQLAIVQGLNIVWRLFTGFHIPGTNITPAHMVFFPAFVTLIMYFLRDFLSMNGSSKGDKVEKK